MAHHSFRELNRVEASLIKQGFGVKRTRNQHLLVRCPKTGRTAMWSSANNDGRSNANSRADLKAIGAIVSPSN